MKRGIPDRGPFRGRDGILNHNDHQGKSRGEDSGDHNLVGLFPSLNLRDQIGHEKGNRVRKNSYRDFKIVPYKEIPGKKLLKDQIGNDQRSDKDGGQNEIDVECQYPFLLRQLDVIHPAKIMKIRIMAHRL